MAIPVLRPLSTIAYNTIRLNDSVHKAKKLVICCAPSSLSNLVGSEAATVVESLRWLMVFLGDNMLCLLLILYGALWAEKDVNPALFSCELMANASRFVEDEEVNYDPRSLIRKAHAATTSIGVVAMLETNGILKIASVGDCGVRVIRKGQIIFSTSPQEHYFDCPYQLSSEAIGQTFLDATVTTVELMEEDTVVMGSDGLFDNVFDREIISIVSSCDNVSDAAKALANLAYNHSKDSSFESPYSQEARTQVESLMILLLLLGR
ncbi:hypothetical protein DH2020_007005 [Rehmannia glutinosa]|uniref:Protein phosphatase n=1 Tax=Rehmannia glutinosa TaxID=99300 RepID=A0ABR0W780_REHGL